jgi:hypothetical protein
MLVGAGCFKTSPKKATPAPAETSALENSPFKQFNQVVTQQDAPAEAPKDLDIPAEAPDIKKGETASASQNVIVSSIVKNQTLGNPFVILGRARAFENQVSWRVRDTHGNDLASGSALTNAPQTGHFGRFRIRAFFNRLPETQTGTVQVYTLGSNNGAEQDMVSIPVKFELKVVAVKAFFSNIKNDPQTLHCEKVYAATRRVPLTQNVAEAAVLELLRGPSAEEQTLGYRTSIYPGTMLRSIAIKDGTASVDFSKEFLYAVAGSCHVQALSAQVEQTLKQYPGVTNVKILVEGQDASDKIQP